MRLGQLARKLALRPSQIVDYLATQEIFMEEGSNARLSDEITKRIVLQFAPERLQEILDDDKSAPSSPEPITVELPVEETEARQDDLEPVTLPQTSVPVNEKPEVIKAPKVELSGLKVLGKIELPEKKKKETTPPGEAQEEKPVIAEQPVRKERPVTSRQKKERYKQRPERNPIALQREQKAREEEEKRKLKAERDKEKRTQYYLQRVKTGQPTKPMKIVSEPVESFPVKEVKPMPKTWLGKFLRWLNT